MHTGLCLFLIDTEVVEFEETLYQVWLMLQFNTKWSPQDSPTSNKQGKGILNPDSELAQKKL
jgi:hypothetical protein